MEAASVDVSPDNILLATESFTFIYSQICYSFLAQEGQGFEVGRNSCQNGYEGSCATAVLGRCKCSQETSANYEWKVVVFH